MCYTHILSEFCSFNVDELDSADLLTRFDTKFIININELNKLLLALKDNYNILDINNIRSFKYHNLYYDTDNLAFYFDHHNDHSNRLKVRTRKYVDSGDTFFEIKKRLNNNKTEKIRHLSENVQLNLLSKNNVFLKERSEIDLNELKPKLTVKYNRITLLHKYLDQKITIDTNIDFKNNIYSANANDLVIIELKQKKQNKTDIESIVRENNGIKTRISKYVLGTILTHKNIKQNRFKEKLIQIKKVTNGVFNN